ncbi:MAG: hypothetical protein LBB25_01245, partial [Holosporaceae bacterium]|nr:hypothetical protein [Holosporaceae bacterium]
MTKLLLFAFLVFLIETQAKETARAVVDEEPATKNDFAQLNDKGPYVGIGLNISRQRTFCDANRDFVGARSRVESTPFGVTAVAGYDHKIYGNLSIGIEAGVDFGSNGKKHGIGNILSQDSFAFRRVAVNVNRLFLNIGRNLGEASRDAEAAGGAGHAVEAGAFRELVNTLRYIGGADVELNDAFINGEEHANGIYNGGVLNGAATFSNFSPAYEGNILPSLGGTNRDAVHFAREFITTYYPKFAEHLRNLHDNGDENLLAEKADALSDFFINFDIGGYNANTLSMTTVASMEDIHTARSEERRV